MGYIVESSGLDKKYGSKYAVNNVSMHIKEGSVYGFVGANGSGKTTIIRLLMGLASPTKGNYSLFGINYKDKRIYYVRKDISSIVEAPSLVPTMTAYDNLKFACLYYGIKDLSVINETLKLVGLENTENKKVKNFSLGMRQRLGIAVLLLNKPKLMLLDEPMNGLDPIGIAELRDLILSLNQRGITFLISSHILSELEKVATDYGFIYDGVLLKEISANDLANECQGGTDLAYHDLKALEKALIDINIKQYIKFPNHIRVIDKIKPLDLLNKLQDKDIEILDFKTVEGNVEDYYLSLVKEIKHHE